MLYEIVYPERRRVTADWIIGLAKDRLINDYLKRHPDADDATIAHRQNINKDLPLDIAMDILSDAGDVTFTTQAREQS